MDPVAEVLGISGLCALVLQHVIEMPATYEPRARFPWDLMGTATEAFAVCREWRAAFRLIVINLRHAWVCTLLEATQDSEDPTLPFYQTGPMPTIVEVMRDVQLELSPESSIRLSEHGLEFNGKEGAVVIPSLDAAEFLAAHNLGQLSAVTVCVALNSDSFNRGLGAGVVAPVEMDFTQGLPHAYTYVRPPEQNELVGRGVRSACVKFHPGMPGGHLRVEGPGGFSNQMVNGGDGKYWACESWTAAGNGMHQIEITVSINGENTVEIPERGWSRSWQCQLFDGRHLPGVFVWIDLGGQRRKPLFVGPISYRLHA